MLRHSTFCIINVALAPCRAVNDLRLFALTSEVPYATIGVPGHWKLWCSKRARSTLRAPGTPTPLGWLWLLVSEAGRGPVGWQRMSSVLLTSPVRAEVLGNGKRRRKP